MIRPVTSVLLFALLLAGCSNSYNPAAEPFKATFPGTPKKIKRTLTQNGMTLKIDYTGYEVENGVYAVTYCDYPAGHVKNLGADNVLTGARNGAAASVGGMITSHKTISLGQHKGQEVKITDAAKGMETRNRMYLVGDRMYQVMVVRKGGSTDDAKAEEFFDSFELK